MANMTEIVNSIEFSDAATRKSVQVIAETDLVGRQKNKAPDDAIGFIRTLDTYTINRAYGEKIEDAFAKNGLALTLIGRTAGKAATFAIAAIVAA